MLDPVTKLHEAETQGEEGQDQRHHGCVDESVHRSASCETGHPVGSILISTIIGQGLRRVNQGCVKKTAACIRGSSRRAVLPGQTGRLLLLIRWTSGTIAPKAWSRALRPAPEHPDHGAAQRGGADVGVTGTAKPQRVRGRQTVRPPGRQAGSARKWGGRPLQRPNYVLQS